MWFKQVARLALGSFVAFAGVSIAQNSACQTVTALSTAPAPGVGVALETYSYCGGTLNVTVYIENVNYNKIVTLYYTNKQNQSTPLSVVQLGYSGDVANTKYEIWAASTPVYVDGITELLNLTYQALDIGHTYTQVLGVNVVATGAAAPAPVPAPSPYANPSGLSQDITNWLEATNGSEAGIAKARMFNNINIPGAANGTVIAAQSYTAPDYAYNWVRDSSLTMDVVYSFYAAATGRARGFYEQILFEYAQSRATEQNDPDTITGLGEPKFYLNNSAFTGPWGRPQNDGPATAAITLMEFANTYLANKGSKDVIRSMIYDSTAHPDQAPVMKDLLFVASNWTYSSFDLWEEEQADHFYIRMVQRRALLMGTAFANMMGDSATAAKLSSAATALTATLPEFWDVNRQLILYEYGPVLRGKSSYKDVAVVLGVIHGYANDGVYGYTNDQILVSAYQIATCFLPVYKIAATTTDVSGAVLGIPVGRYPEDVYDGLLYRASAEYTATGSLAVTTTSLPFFAYFAPDAGLAAGQTYKAGSQQFEAAVAALQGWADAFIRRIKFQTPTDGHLAEEFNRDTGVAQGAKDLTWSYASLLTAAFARAQVTGDKNYVKHLANLGLTE
ncbi:hypothetical protein B0A49_11671 [Cryomyces minteri]|uniref:glucan 1,4-alpha-glucosidase n=1 Tax=Cryomyces minteri TaxID=331657 RepID=A0A4U0VQ26_9PEZI|nr:hypothetical protein B0A49_11671 [Cryomyces minteri]